MGPKGGGGNREEEVDASPGFSFVEDEDVILGFLSRVQVAVKIIDKTQLNSSSLQKVSARHLRG